jgi:hypothetical protein
LGKPREKAMKSWKRTIAFTALIVGILTISIPLAAGAHKKLAKLQGMNTSQMMIDVKNLPVVNVAEPY